MEYLRELARKKLGPGHSKLRRDELLQALAKFLPADREKAAKVSTRRAPVVQSAMKKIPAGEGGKKVAPAAEPGKASRSKKVAIEDVAEEHEKKRSATLKKKVDGDSLETEAKKGARPVTARLSETKPALSKGVARVKSAIANIAKEVEARRVAREADSAPKAAAKANIQKEQVASRAVLSKEIEPAAKAEQLPSVKSAAPKRAAKAAAASVSTKAGKSVPAPMKTPGSEAKLSETPKPATGAKAKSEAAKPAAAAKAKPETVEAAKPAVAAKAKAETVEAAKPVVAAKAKAEMVEDAKPAAAANVEAVEVRKPDMAERAKTGNVEAPKPAAAAKPEFVPQPVAPAAREARPGAGAVITEAPWLQTAAKLQAERAETLRVATLNVESREV
ncbi:MAG: hypothetical protein M3Y59_14375, partial [Myxococcota bacterium]|nr:hypothetical protein [Myxococcota bacterium]